MLNQIKTPQRFFLAKEHDKLWLEKQQPISKVRKCITFEITLQVSSYISVSIFSWDKLVSDKTDYGVFTTPSINSTPKIAKLSNYLSKCCVPAQQKLIMQFLYFFSNVAGKVLAVWNERKTRCRKLHKIIFIVEKDFTLEVAINSQNDWVYGQKKLPINQSQLIHQRSTFSV